ncbi:MAG TPA: hypothetical protein VMV81_03365, partial [Phycisphaerae bacterium]|nr:hypothetical protein [Phycisphaerae bacterium]
MRRLVLRPQIWQQDQKSCSNMGTSHPITSRIRPPILFFVIAATLIGVFVPQTASAQVVISQIFGGGNQLGSLYTADYIEL